MKTLFGTLTAAAILGASLQSTSAGDREWATAGKVLTGVVAGAALLKAFEPVPVYYQPVTYYMPPVVQAPPVYVQQPTVVYAQPAPAVVYARTPVVVHAAPVYMRPAPVYFSPAPVVSFHFGFGRRHHHAPPVFICR